MRRTVLLLAAMMLSLVAASGVAYAATVSNGGFEAGDLDGWTAKKQEGSSGRWFAYSGTTSPTGAPIAAPPVGEFAATTDQDDPGSRVLYKNVKLAAGKKHTLSFYVYYQNSPASFATPNTLNFNGDDNQQYRVDVMKPSAGAFSVKRADVLARVFRTEVGDPGTLAPTRLTYNLTPFAGKTVRLRFAQVDNMGNFWASVDQVKVSSQSR
jgi:hypothetical protein